MRTPFTSKPAPSRFGLGPLVAPAFPPYLKEHTMNVLDLMTDLMTTNAKSCGTMDNLERAAQIMWENDCGVVPVVDGSERVVGMVTDRDICMAAYTQGQPL
jgi:CBS domain-containing protein